MFYASDGTPMTLGHMTLKSSPLCPNGGKLTSQYLVVDHLVAHYKKIKNVKSQVDTSAPKTWLASQKVRDRRMREAYKTGNFPQDLLLRLIANTENGRQYLARTSELDRSTMMGHMQALNLESDIYDDLDGTMSPVASIKTTKRDSRAKTDRQFSETFGLQTRERSRSLAREPSWTSARYDRTLTPKQDVKFMTQSDLIETRRHMFTEEKPFTPRTLKTNMTSKIAKQGCYNPPMRRTKSAQANTNKNKNAIDQNATMKSLGDTVGFNDTLLTDTMRSYDSRERSTPSGVPPLNISQDQDNLKWLKEQSRLNEANRAMAAPPSNPTTAAETKHLVTQPVAKASPRRTHAPSDEDILYLNFLTDVTNDILDRGIFTNRALKQVFETHIANHQGHLKVSKMHGMIEDLRKKLGIPEHDFEDEGFGFGSSQKLAQTNLIHSNTLDDNSLLMTRQTFDPKQFKSGRRGSRGLGAAISNRTHLTDVQEVLEDDLSGESSRTGKIKRSQPKRGDRKDADENISLASDTSRTVGNATFEFDELDHGLLGTTQVISPKTVTVAQSSMHGKVATQTDKASRELEHRRVSSAGQMQRSPEHRTHSGTGPSSPLLTSPKHVATHSPDSGRSVEPELLNSQRSDYSLVDGVREYSSVKGPVPKPRSPHSKQTSPEATRKSPKYGANGLEHTVRSPELIMKHSESLANGGNISPASPGQRSPGSGQEHHSHDGTNRKQMENDNSITRLTEADGGGAEFDDESSLLDTLGEYKHSLEITDNYDDDYEDDDGNQSPSN